MFYMSGNSKAEYMVGLYFMKSSSLRTEFETNCFMARDFWKGRIWDIINSNSNKIDPNVRDGIRTI